jgi:hypothetical protein
VSRVGLVVVEVTAQVEWRVVRVVSVVCEELAVEEPVFVAAVAVF